MGWTREDFTGVVAVWGVGTGVKAILIFYHYLQICFHKGKGKHNIVCAGDTMCILILSTIVIQINDP